MFPEQFAFVGALISSAGGFYYTYETIRGKTKPNRVTWLLWTIFPILIFFAQQAQGVESISYTSLIYAAPSLLTFIASITISNAYWKTKKLDYFCLASALLGLILWYVTDSPIIAIIFILIADFSAGLPTIIKSITHPETESWKAFAVDSIGGALALCSIQVWNFEGVALIGQIFVVSTFIAIASSRKRGPTTPDSVVLE